jgi:molecular chaperone GrpE
MTEDRDKPPDEPFDAIAAAAELEASLSESRTEPGSPDRYVTMLEEEVAALSAELSKEKAATAAAQARAERAFAEIEQTRARIERDAERRSQQRGRELLVGFLEVQDDADRAVAAIRSSDASRNLLAGVEALQRRLERALEAQGMHRQLALGVGFDPALHEAISVQPVPDAERDGLILSVAREGYELGDEVLRPARVVVGKRSR